MAELPTFDWSDVAESAAPMRAALAEEGLFVVRGLLSTAEIERLRGIVSGHLTRAGRRLSLGKTQPNAASIVPELAFIFSHPRILAVMKQILGEDGVVFTGHCDIHMNMLSGWHKDSGETVPGGYFRGAYMTAEECRVYKVAIYLQEPGAHDGFTARLGSHRHTALDAGELVKVPSRVGDIVVFDVRLTHTGQLPDPIEKGMKGLSLALNNGSRNREDFPLISKAKASYWKLIGRRDRLSVFFTYGAANDFTYDFAKANMSRQARQGAGGKDSLPDGLMATLRQEGVSVHEFTN